MSPVARRATLRLVRLAVLCLTLAAVPCLPQEPEVDPVKVAQVKAAYVLNFLRYTDWPLASFPKPDSPYRVVVLGDPAIAAELTALAQRSGPVNGRAVVIRAERLAAPTEKLAQPLLSSLQDAHVLYLGKALSRMQVREILGGLEHTEVLTVGDMRDFADGGGMLGLVLSGNRIVFDANPAAIRRTGLQVSAKVLKLARIVEPGGTP